MSKIRHMKGAGRQHDTVILNFVGKYRQRATKLIKTVGFYAACLVLHESALIFRNEKSRIGLLCIFEKFSTLGRVYYEVRYAMTKRPCARHEGLWKSGHVNPLIRNFSIWWKLQAPVALPSRKEPTVLIA